LVNILENEKIQYKLEDVVKIVNGTYPDIRRSINLTQQFSLSGELKSNEIITLNYIDEIIQELEGKKSASIIRQIIVDNDVKDFQEIYRAFYEKYFDKENILIILGEYQYKHVLVLDKEINFMVCVVKMIKELKNKTIYG